MGTVLRVLKRRTTKLRCLDYLTREIINTFRNYFSLRLRQSWLRQILVTASLEVSPFFSIFYNLVTANLRLLLCSTFDLLEGVLCQMRCFKTLDLRLPFPSLTIVSNLPCVFLEWIAVASSTDFEDGLFCLSMACQSWGCSNRKEERQGEG